MFGWLARRRERIRLHEQLWEPERATASDGLSRFQLRAEAALAAAEFPLRDREVQQLNGGEPMDLYVTGLAGRADARVFLYQDGIEVRTGREVVRFEDWDSETPDTMIRTLVDAIRQSDGLAPDAPAV